MATSIVFGGAGFLGSHLVDALTARGESVVVIDDLTTGRLSNLGRAISSGRVTFVYVDLPIDADLLRKVVRSSQTKHVDYLYWFGPPSGDRGTSASIDVAVEERARLIVSSLAGNRPETGLEWAGAAVETLVAAAVRDRGLDARSVRVWPCYGPRAHAGDAVVEALLEAALAGRPMPIEGNGLQVRPITYVLDAIDRLVEVAHLPQASFEPIEIRGNDERSVLDIARILARTAGTELVVECGPATQCPRVLRRALRNLGSATARTTPLEQGLRSTYAWFANEIGQFV
jgi:nucleoside-diphosphate-sugar epimerase